MTNPQRPRPEPPPSGRAPDEPGHGWRVGTVGGVPVYIGGGWLVIALFLVVLFGPQVQRELPQLGLLAYAVALVYALLLLVSVLVHEAAHAVAARRCGFVVHRVAADLIGGHTSYLATRPTPGRTALVAAVGPLANGVLALAGWALLPTTTPGVVQLLLGALTWANAFVAVFNLLPGIPLDGGHLLQSLVWAVTGSRHRGMLVAGWAGRLVAVAVVGFFLALPLTRGQAPSLLTLAWVGILAAFMWMGAGQAVRGARLHSRLGRVAPADVVHPVRLMPAAAPLSALPGPTPTEARTPLPALVVVVDDTGHPLGVLDPAAYEEARQAGDAGAPATTCLRAAPPEWVVDLDPDNLAATALLEAFQDRGTSLLLLRDRAGTPYGLVQAGELASLLDRRPGGGG